MSNTVPPHGMAALLLKRISCYLLDSRRGGPPVRWTRIRDYVAGMLAYARSLRESVPSSMFVPQPFCAVLASFRRPENMRWIVAGIERVSAVQKIVLLNNNPAISVTSLTPSNDPRIVRIQADRRQPPTVRFFEALNHDFRWYLVVDDDLFLQPRQIMILMNHLMTRPECPHGILGDRQDKGKQHAWERVVPAADNEAVDVLLRVYAFTRDQAVEFGRLHSLMTSRGVDCSLADDLLMSRTGSTRPMVHSVGPWVNCLSSGDSSIALFRTAGFDDRRVKAWDILVREKPFK